MDYYEIKLTVFPNTETVRDVLSGALASIGFESFVESEQGINAYVPAVSYNEKVLDSILHDFPLPDVSATYSAELVESRDWNEEWEKHFFSPIVIDNQLVIHSSFHKNIPSMKYDIVIDPKMAFGTGHHATTLLMAIYMLETDFSGKCVLDMGCGTAALSLLAKMKGALNVDAIDNDEWAYRNALENIRLNNMPDINVKLGDASILIKESYEYIFANINRNILLQDVSAYVFSLRPGGSLFVSGFYSEDKNCIEQEFKKHKLELVSVKEKDNWLAMHFHSTHELLRHPCNHLICNISPTTP